MVEFFFYFFQAMMAKSTNNENIKQLSSILRHRDGFFMRRRSGIITRRIRTCKGKVAKYMLHGGGGLSLMHTI
jgi:hypothetical protein